MIWQKKLVYSTILSFEDLALLQFLLKYLALINQAHQMAVHYHLQ